MSEGPSSPAGGGSHESEGDLSPRSSNVKEQDKFLPIANITRIIKKGLPANGKVAKDAKETIQECVSEFISFITSEASDKCLKEKRKTMSGDDLIWAMETLGFEDYIDPLEAYLSRFKAGTPRVLQDLVKKGFSLIIMQSFLVKVIHKVRVVVTHRGR